VSGLENLSNHPALFLFPNPSDQSISISGIQPSETVQSLQIINHLGQVVVGENKIFSNINVHTLEKGHYFVRISTSERIEVLEFIR
jgi:hypothetical protein